MGTEIKEGTLITEQCNLCNENIELEEGKHLKEFDGKKLCEDCYNDNVKECEDCNEEVWEDDIHSVEGGDRYVCNNCNDNYYSCENCDYRYHEDNGYYCGDCEVSYCESCGDDHYHDDADDFYRSYQHTPIRGNVDKAKYLKYDRLVGIEIETNNGKPNELAKMLDRTIGITSDGSVHGSNPVELQTPPASADVLEKLIDNATKSLKKAKYGVDRSCGLHIHIDSSDIKDKQSLLIKLFNTYYTIEPIIWAMLPKSRRNNGFCKPITSNISPNDFKTIIKSTRTKDNYYIQKKWYRTEDTRRIDGYKGDKCGGDRYYGFNGHALYGLGHLELRYHSGTINKKKIRNWVELNLLLHEWAIKKYKKITLDVLNSIPSDEENIERKLNLFFRLFEVPTHLREYISERVAKFRDVNIDEQRDENTEDTDSQEVVALAN